MADRVEIWKIMQNSKLSISMKLPNYPADNIYLYIIHFITKTYKFDFQITIFEFQITQKGVPCEVKKQCNRVSNNSWNS